MIRSLVNFCRGSKITTVSLQNHRLTSDYKNGMLWICQSPVFVSVEFFERTVIIATIAEL